MNSVKAILVILCAIFLVPALVHADLIAHWEFEDSADDSVGGFSGTMNGGQYVDGKVGKAAQFDGQDDYIDCGNILNDIQTPFSIAAWVKIDDFTENWVFSSENSFYGGYDGFWFGFAPDGDLEISYGDGGGANPMSRRTKKSSGDFASEWLHIAGVVRGAEDMDLYVNGVDVGGYYS